MRVGGGGPENQPAERLLGDGQHLPHADLALLACAPRGQQARLHLEAHSPHRLVAQRPRGRRQLEARSHARLHGVRGALRGRGGLLGALLRGLVLGLHARAGSLDRQPPDCQVRGHEHVFDDNRNHRNDGDGVIGGMWTLKGRH